MPIYFNLTQVTLSWVGGANLHQPMVFARQNALFLSVLLRLSVVSCYALYVTIDAILREITGSEFDRCLIFKDFHTFPIKTESAM